MDLFAAYGGLFAAAFAAATILPAQSEAALAGLLATDAGSRRQHRKFPRFDGELGSWSRDRTLSRQALVSRPFHGARPSHRLVSSLWKMVPAVELGTDHRRPADRGRGGVARAAMELCRNRRPREDYALPGCRRGGAEPDVNQNGRHTRG
jgi:hypothetical protein